jgi:hypothetical protein
VLGSLRWILLLSGCTVHSLDGWLGKKKKKKEEKQNLSKKRKRHISSMAGWADH